MFAATLSVCFALVGGGANLAANAEQIWLEQGESLTTSETYQNNLADWGGAILNNGSLTTNGASFISNKASTGGGAVYNASFNAVFNNSKFNSNSATYGGAQFQNGGVVNISGSEFSNNSATHGGVLFTQGTDAVTSISNGTKFINNTASGYAGVMYTNSAVLSVKDALFEGNHSDLVGGAVFLSNGNLNITNTFENTRFVNNTAVSTGAIYSLIGKDANGYNTTIKTTINNCLFQNNEAEDVGAIGNFTAKGINGDGGMTITNTKFITNKATSSTGEGGGALFLGSESVTKLDHVAFDGNTSEANGGAIATRYSIGANGKKNDNSEAKLDILNSTFKNNEAKGIGGAIDNYFYGSEGKEGGINIVNTVFDTNSAQNGGAIYNHGELDKKDSNASLSIIGSTFNNNFAENDPVKSAGGAIYNKGSFEIDSTNFSGNWAGKGGAIYSIAENEVSSIKNSNFIDNEARNGAGGALFFDNYTDVARKEIVTIENSYFKGNSATSQAGAIQINAAKKVENVGLSAVNISNSIFEENTGGNGGGAISNYDKLTLNNVEFKNNSSKHASSDGGGGALMLGSWSQTKISDAIFEGNKSAGLGGAIATRVYNAGNNSLAKLDIENAVFANNEAVGKGGAIYNAFYNSETAPNTVSIKSTIFSGNKSGADGGAIYNEVADKGGNLATVAIEDSSFVNNSAAGKGGAIFANADLTVFAINKDVVFAGNKATDGGDIYMNAENSTLKINLDNEKVVTIKDGISGNQDKYNIAIEGFGNIDLQSYIKNANVTVNDATLWLNTGSQVNGLNNLITMNDNSELITINGQIDKFDEGLFTLNGNVDLAVDVDLATGKADFFKNAISDASTGKFVLEGVKPIANTTGNVVQINLYDALGLDKGSVEINPDEFVAMKALTPIRYLSGSVSQDGILTYAPAGKSYKDFNPAVMASPVAAQLGGYLTQLNSYDEAFRNMDMYMLLNQEQRNVLKMRNRYAIQDGNAQYQESGTAWARPYATFENVSLRGGAKVSNVSYGSFFGGESQMYDLGHGWDGMWGAYAGYNGSHQAFNGIGIYQNGGTLGVVGMAYKGNFFTGLTINAGANGGEASTMYGNDNFSMLMAGIASKTGYNIELAKGRFIIQPSFLMSYSFVNTFDYTNAAGVRINSDPLNAIHIEPGLKFIGNLKNGLQPYVGVSMVWNIMDKTDFRANNVSLPDLSVKPYVKYGVGVRKSWGERLTGFFQCYFTNGGRNGVGLQAGFKWAIGKDTKSVPTVNKTPEIKKTEIKLSCNR